MRIHDARNRKIRSRDLAVDLEVLRSFVEVADAGNLTRAAERLGRAQSTISVHIAKLEDIYSGALFHRNGHGVVLTERGSVVRFAALRMLDEQVRVLATLRNSGLTGPLRVGIMDDYALDRFPRVLKSFAAENPGLALRVEVGLSAQLHESIANHEIDLAVLRRHSGGEGGKILAREELKWVAAPGAVFSEDAPIPLVMFDKACLYRGAVIEALTQNGRDHIIAASSSSLGGVVASCLAGLGVTVLSESTIPKSLTRYAGERLPGLDDTEIAVMLAKDAPAAAGELEKILLLDSVMTN